MKVMFAAAALRQIIERRAGDPAVVVQAIRAAAAIRCAAPVLTRIVADGQGDPLLRVDCTGRGRGTRLGLDVMLDLLSDSADDSRSCDAQPCAN